MIRTVIGCGSEKILDVKVGAYPINYRRWRICQMAFAVEQLAKIQHDPLT